MRSILRGLFTAGAILLLGSSPRAQSITINSPAPNTSVNPGSLVTVSVTVSGAAAGIQSITVLGERDPSGAETASFPPSPPVGGITETFTYVVPLDATVGEELTITASALFYADSPVNTSIIVLGGGTPGPANDNFPGTTITGSSGTTSGTSASATRQTGEPTTFGMTARSVWFQWTPAVADQATTFNTTGSAFDTVLGVYTGSAVDALTGVAKDDQSGGANTSALTFNPAMGTTYYIQVGSWASSGGAYTLNWSSVALTSANDEWSMYE